jgi:flagellar secretion chaperone FliS
MNFGAKSYKNTAIQTAKPEQILLMLYEAAIKSCKLAKVAMDKKNINDKCMHISKVHDIVMELNNTLDHSKGKEVSEQLEGLYDFCITQLLKANMDNSLESIDNVQKVLTTLYEGWVEAVGEVRKKGVQKI